jgi:hypothetical protein
MEMVGHYDVGEQKKTARGSSFFKRCARNCLNGVRAKNRQAVVGYRRYEQTWVVL